MTEVGILNSDSECLAWISSDNRTFPLNVEILMPYQLWAKILITNTVIFSTWLSIMNDITNNDRTNSVFHLCIGR